MIDFSNNTTMTTLSTCLRILRENQMTGATGLVPSSASKLTHYCKVNIFIYSWWKLYHFLISSSGLFQWWCQSADDSQGWPSLLQSRSKSHFFSPKRSMMLRSFVPFSQRSLRSPEPRLEELQFWFQDVGEPIVSSTTRSASLKRLLIRSYLLYFKIE